MGVNLSNKRSSLKNRNWPYLFQMLPSCREVKGSGLVFNATKLLLRLEFLNQSTHIICSKTCTIFLFPLQPFTNNCVSWEPYFRVSESTSGLYKRNTSCLSLFLPLSDLDLFNFKRKVFQRDCLKGRERRVERICSYNDLEHLSHGVVRRCLS